MEQSPIKRVTAGRSREGEMTKQVQRRGDMMMKTTRRVNLHSLIAVALVCALTVAAHAADDKKEKEQKDVRAMAQDTLQRLYKADPKAKAALEGAAGYAAFAIWA